VMALLIREKLSGSHAARHWRAGEKISTELQVLPPPLAAATRGLRECRCPMNRNMKCLPGCPSLPASASAPTSEGSSSQAQASAAKDGSGAPGAEGEQGGGGARRRARRKYGEILLSPVQVAEKVKEMGGVEAVEGQQGRKGSGWKTVGAALGIDVIHFRDCGFHVSVLPVHLPCHTHTIVIQRERVLIHNIFLA